MKVCVLQPHYSMNGADVDACFADLLALLDGCDESLDLIVLPEYSDVPADVAGDVAFAEAAERNAPRLLAHARETAIRCHALVFVNCAHRTERGLRNTTYAFGRDGELCGRYFKAHPAPSEVRSGAEGGHGLDVGYSYEFAPPYVLDIEGVRYAFLTCYDFYFYEGFARIARERPDVIIGCSLQRTDPQATLSFINRFLAYQTNAYLVRASVSLGEGARLSGGSTVITPAGEVLLDMQGECGRGTAEIDPHEKYLKPAGHGGSLQSHPDYMEVGRRPWLYRNAGPSTSLFEDVMPYPRLCAHRGLHRTAPENSLPAYGAAVALGAPEIELDLWATADGVLVSCHDERLERVSNGTGKIADYTLRELRRLDFGSVYDQKYRGLRIPTFEEILSRFAGRCILNVHVKLWEVAGYPPMIDEVIEMIRRYDCERYVYLMIVNDEIHREVLRRAPDIATCVGWNGDKDPLSMPRRAITLGAKKVQLYKPYFNEETFALAKAHGVLCNVFWANDPAEARSFYEMGADTVLTDDYLPLSQALADILDTKQ